MKSVTWVHGTDQYLDSLFDELREKRYQDKKHRLWANYSSEFLKFSSAVTICFDDNGLPEMCSSIAIRECWPENSFRILNRLWKTSNFVKYPKTMSKSFADSAASQVEWLKNNKKVDLIFASRQTERWQSFGLDVFNSYGLDFKIDDKYYYLTCPNECDDTCWQKILYIGNDNTLLKWKRRL
jgi:hypothetical protein